MQISPLDPGGGVKGFVWMGEANRKYGEKGKWELHGASMQVLNVALGPGEELKTEPGSMMFMGPGLKAEADCSGCCSRCLGGEPCAIMHYVNESGNPSYIGLTPSLPAEIIALDLASLQKVKCRRGAYMSSLGDVKPSFDVDCNPLTACCAGFGMCRQTVSGTSGTAFISAMGTVEMKTLGVNETIIIDSNSLVAWTEPVQLGVRTAGSCMVCCCNGEGCCNTTVTGPGTAWIQSMSFPQYKAQMGVTVQLDQFGNLKSVGAPPSPEMHRD
ncbi:tryptophan RNA-binding attenuator protein-like domain-containing protein [Pelagophyceae sp. CCMP2097]|nr:tryptophan RNA-binding attenuator protein-like domain-containing protein [Pelagophyceae sp. CCMP2097]|mmetsp:Transcript_20491/g.70777  ORF Transcript_20491/g.70777 Transcript_20491/m.70777 type:complete len:271 (-) Transcript_20491:115-927(-)